jgi:hypothetical protein
MPLVEIRQSYTVQIFICICRADDSRFADPAGKLCQPFFAATCRQIAAIPTP